MNEQTLTPKAVMIQLFNIAKAVGASYVGVDVVIDNNVNPEMIINRKEDFDAKRDYYDAVYDDNLVHKHAKTIKITNIVYGHTAEETATRLEQGRLNFNWRDKDGE